jgi:hypothetical protein
LSCIVVNNVSFESIDGNANSVLLIYEWWDEPRNRVSGVIVRQDNFSELRNHSSDMFMAKLLLQQHSSGGFLTKAVPTIERNTVVESIADLFSITLRHIPVNDKWQAGGRDYFTERLQYYVSRNRKIQMCLPAFPCKSSNRQKVGGSLPDRGEYVALQTLYAFTEAVGELYAPGAEILIISDGHVFSNCSKYFFASFLSMMT